MKGAGPDAQGIYLPWFSYPSSLGVQVGSRMVIVAAGCVLLLMGMFGKIGAAFATIPTPVIGGMFLVMFGIISAVGISNLQVRHLSEQQRHPHPERSPSGGAAWGRDRREEGKMMRGGQRGGAEGEEGVVLGATLTPPTIQERNVQNQQYAHV